MDDHRTVSVSRIYVPNEYTVYLSTADRAQFEAYEASLKLELQEYLAQHAKREGYVMLSPAGGRDHDGRRSRRRRVRDRHAHGPGSCARRLARRDAVARGRPDDDLQAGGGRRARGEAGQGGRADRSRRRRQATPDRQAHHGDRALPGMRHPARRREHLQAACGASPAGDGLLDRRPRVDERRRGEREPRGAGAARGRRHGHARRDAARLQSSAP